MRLTPLTRPVVAAAAFLALAGCTDMGGATSACGCDTGTKTACQAPTVAILATTGSDLDTYRQDYEAALAGAYSTQRASS